MVLEESVMHMPKTMIGLELCIKRTEELQQQGILD